MEASSSDCSPSSLLEAVARFTTLGDRRLDHRVIEMAKQSLGSAKSSLAAMFGRKKKEIKASQSLLSNSRVDILDLREVLYGCALEQIEICDVKTILSIFDPTLLDYSAQGWKQDRMAIGDGNGLGYELLNCILVEPEGKRVLGVAHQTLLSKQGPDDRHELDYTQGVKKRRARAKMLTNHPNHFLTIAKAVDERLPKDLELIHVADREFDDGLVLRSRSQARSHFVIRAKDTRVVQVHNPGFLPEHLRRPASRKELDDNAEGLFNVLVDDLAERMPCPIARTIFMDVRGRVCRDASQVARIVRLEAGAIPIRLARQSKRAQQAGIAEEPVWINLVVVREAAGQASRNPIRWLLTTDLPISSSEEIERVIGFYERRWRVEEYFRTVKDAMKLEESELDDPLSTARLIFFVTLKAIFLDELRLRAELPAGVPTTSEQRKALRDGAKQAEEIESARRKGLPVPEIPARQRAIMALGVIAERGGWIGKSLGNYILLRGLPTFLHDVAEGRYAWLVAEDTG